MEEIKTSHTGQGLGVAGLVLGIIALIISFIPCLGMWALIPGIIAIVFSAIAFSQANKVNAAKGLVIAALAISIVGTAIAGWQMYMLKNASTHIEKFGKELQKAIEDEMDEEDIESLEEAMEELEGQIEEITEDVIEEITESTSETLKETAEELEEIAEELEEGDEK